MADGNRENAAQPETPDVGTTTMSSPVRKPAPPKQKPRKLPPYKVLLHNDDVNTLEHVIKSIRRLMVLNAQEATLKALEAHESGVTLLVVTHRERAELFVEQFASLSLTATIEPAEA